MINLNNTSKDLILKMKNLGIINKISDSNLPQSFLKAQSQFPDNQDLIWEVLMASDVSFGADAECGRIPPDYDNLTMEILQKFYPEIEDLEVKMDHGMKDDRAYWVSVSMKIKEEEFITTLDDFGDYYDYQSVVKFIEESIPKKESNQSIYDIETNDQGFLLLLLDLNQIKKLYDHYEFIWKDKYIDQLVLGEWTSSIYEDPIKNIRDENISIKDIYAILNDSDELDDYKLNKLCEKLSNRNEEEIPQILESIYLSKYKESSETGRSILSSKHNYSDVSLLNLVLENIDNPNRLESLNNYISIIFHLKVKYLPKFSKMLDVLKLVEKYNLNIKLNSYEWAILLFGYDENYTFRRIINTLKSTENLQVKKVCIETLSLYAYAGYDLFLVIKRKTVFSLFTKILKDEYEQSIFSSMQFFFSHYTANMEFSKLYSLFQEVHHKFDVIDLMNMIKIINRNLYLNEYYDVIEDDYMMFFQKNTLLQKYVIIGLLQSRNKKALNLLENKKDLGHFNEAFNYNRNDAMKELSNLKKAVLKLKRIVKDKR